VQPETFSIEHSEKHGDPERFLDWLHRSLFSSSCEDEGQQWY
jgi:hypothetical protein